MRASRFENDLKNLALDIATNLNMKPKQQEFYESLLDCMIGLKTYNKRVENLIATGELINELVVLTQADLLAVFQKNHKVAHENIINKIIVVFTKYGTTTYKEGITEQAKALPANMWKTGTFTLSLEPLLELFFQAYISYANAPEETKGKAKSKAKEKELIVAAEKPKKKKVAEGEEVKVEKPAAKKDLKPYIERLLGATQLLLALEEDLEVDYK